MRRVLALMLIIGVGVTGSPIVCADQKCPKGILNSHDLALLYYANAGVPVPWEEVVKYFPEYEKAPDEFVKHDFLEKMMPKMTSDLEKMKSAKLFSTTDRKFLSKYDFKRKGFPFPLNKGTYHYYEHSPYDPDFSFSYENVEEFSFLSVGEEIAREIVRFYLRKHKYRDTYEVDSKITFEPVSASLIEGRQRYRNTMCRITKLEIFVKGGSKLFEISDGTTSVFIGSKNRRGMSSYEK